MLMPTPRLAKEARGTGRRTAGLTTGTASSWTSAGCVLARMGGRWCTLKTVDMRGECA